MAFILKPLLKEFWYKSRLMAVLVVLVTLIGALAAIAAPYVFSQAIDDLTKDAQHISVLKMVILYACLFGCAKALGQIARFLIFLSAERLSLIANTAFFDRLLRKTPAFFLEHNAAEIGTARQQGTQTLTIVAQLGLGGILPSSVQIAFSVILLGQLVSWEIALIVLAYGATVVGIDYFRIGRVKPALDAAVARSQANARLVGNAIAVIDTLRQTRGEHWIAGRFAGDAREAFANWQRYTIASSVFCGILGAAAALQLAVTFLILVPRYQAGLISIGGIVLFNTLLIQLNEPFHLVGTAIKEMVEAAARFRPFATMWLAPEQERPANPVPYRPSEGILIFEDVAFHYPNGQGISGISLVAHRGTPLFITGETGSGKSTVLRLLLKGLQPTKGRILVDGVDLTRVTSEDWFAHVGVVPQDVTLLNDTLAANIVLGRSFDRDRLRRAADRASILARVDTMPEGFETMVGERGLKLSGGERQRIAIARALYDEPSILVLDEASSALDDDTERQIMDSLREISDSLTIIAVTHRTSMIRPNDQIYRLK